MSPISPTETDQTHLEIPVALLREQQEVVDFAQELGGFLRQRSALFWGTLLGAVRHGGFIPWDDDLDVLVNRADLKDLKEFSQQRGVELLALPGQYFKLYRADGVLCRPEVVWRWPYIDVFVYDLIRGEARIQFGQRTVRMPASQLLPFRPILFEGTPWLGPACPLAALSNLYGDFERYRISTFDHRQERHIPIDEIVERVNLAFWNNSKASLDTASTFPPVALIQFERSAGPLLVIGAEKCPDVDLFRQRGLEADIVDPFSASAETSTLDLSRYRRIYSRGALHLLSARQQRHLLQRLAEVESGTVICLEFRDSADGSMLTPMANDARLFFDDGHFRRLLVIDDVLVVFRREFAVLYHQLGRFRPTAMSNPVITRLAVIKN